MNVNEKEILIRRIMTEVLQKSDTETQNFIINYYQGFAKFETRVAGTTFRDNAQNILRFLSTNVSPDDIVIDLEREPDNPYDPNAIKVILSVTWSKKRYHIGYIPKNLAAFFVEMMSKGIEIRVLRAIVVGGFEESANYGLRLIYDFA